MKLSIRLARFVKGWGLRTGVARLFAPVSGPLITLAQFSRMARWARGHEPLPYSDRGHRKFDLSKRLDLYDHVFRTEGLDGPIDYLEFGVAGGDSFLWWAHRNRHPEARFIGFDTFTGLPEEWGGFAAGTFSTGGRTPQIEDSRCSFEVGLFQDTLGPFLEENPLDRRMVVHLDADLYSSTLFVLTRLATRLKPGDILFFDEFGVPAHEFRAFEDFVAAYRLKYRVLGAINNIMQMAVRVE